MGWEGGKGRVSGMDAKLEGNGEGDRDWRKVATRLGM